jgi:hypothetical protein
MIYDRDHIFDASREFPSKLLPLPKCKKQLARGGKRKADHRQTPFIYIPYRPGWQPDQSLWSAALPIVSCPCRVGIAL